MFAVFFAVVVTTQSSPHPGDCFVQPTWNNSEIQRWQNIQYGSAYNNYTNQTQNLFLDVYAPIQSLDTRQARPAMVLIHGGSFVGGDKQGPEQEFRGMVVVSINYRLTGKYWGTISPPGECCPGTNSDQYAFDAAHDGKAAVRFLRKMASKWRIDPTRIGISGDSAGAVTVLFMGYVADVGEGDSGNPGFSSAVSLVAPVSGELKYDAFCKGLDAHGNPFGCHYGIWDRVNNVTGADGQPPLCMIHGTNDTTVPIREAKAIQTRANEVGLSNELITIVGGQHVPMVQFLSGHLDTFMEFAVKSMDLAGSQCPRHTSDALQS
eukprot:gene488-10260_t